MLWVPAKSTMNCFFHPKTSGSTQHHFSTVPHRIDCIELGELRTHPISRRVAASRELVTRFAQLEISCKPVLACALANL
jgi:hypothetical protein